MRTLKLSLGVAVAGVAGLAATAVAQPAYVSYGDAMDLAETDWQVPSSNPLVAEIDPSSAADAYLYPSYGGSGGLCAAPSAHATTAAQKPSPYPRAVIDRPYVLPFKVAVVSADLASRGMALDGVAQIAAGLPHHLDASVGFDQPLGVLGGSSRLIAGAGAQLYRSKMLSVAAHTKLDLDTTTGGFGASVTGVRVAAVVAHKLGLWMRPEQLVIDAAGTAPTSLVLPLSIGVQALPLVWFQADADFEVATMRDRHLVGSVRESIPVGMSAVVSLAPTVDLRAGVTADVGSRGVITPTSRWMFGLSYILGG